MSGNHTVEGIEMAVGSEQAGLCGHQLQLTLEDLATAVGLPVAN